MSQTISQPLDADDPGLTAYALGELDGPDAAKYAELVAGSADLQACVAEIQAAARLLTSELAQEPQVPISAERQQEIATQASQSQPVATSRKQRFPTFARRAAAVAASIALVPGAWYAFHAAFPGKSDQPDLQMLARATPQSGKSGEYILKDHVQYPPGKPAPASVSGPASQFATAEFDTEGKQDSRTKSETLIASAESRQRFGDFDGISEGVAGDVAKSSDHKVSVTSTVARSSDKSPLARDPLADGAEIDESSPHRSDSSRTSLGSDGRAGEGKPTPPGLVNGPQGNASIEAAPEASTRSLKGNKNDFDKTTAEVRKRESREGDSEAGQSSGKPGSQPSPTASTPADPKQWSELDKRRFKYKESIAKPGESKPADYALKSGSTDQPTEELRTVVRGSRLSIGSGAGGAKPQSQKGDPAGFKGGAGAKTLETIDGYSVGGPAVANGLSKTPGPTAKRSGDALSAKTSPQDPSEAAESKGVEESLVREKLKQPLNNKEVALAEIDRLRSMPLGDLSKKDVQRLGWAKKELGWQDGNWDQVGNEAYNPIFENTFINPAEQQLSTFSIDVDTASYANLRRFLQNGQLPPPDAVRVEELVNYFAYQYPQPQDGRPFSVQTDIAACPWQPGHQLVRIGLKGKEIPKEQRLPTNLVFLVDVSGSMSAQNKLPLVRESLTTLVKQLDERDKVAIVTYAGEAGLRLPSTSVAQREVVLNAIAGLGAGGSTNGAAGINTAYDIAAQEFLEKGTNRVILCTDGDFNVGVTSDDALVQMIQTRAKGGVFLSIFGFGMGNLKDAKLEQLADKGNGQYGYIDDTQEANKVFVQELMGTLVTIAKDVKIQIDFNKETVEAYRLVGYENRVMAAEDFANDKKDAGEIGAGHTVTALYQIVPTKDLKVNDETRWLTVKLRYKQPEAATSVLFENPLVGQPGQLKLAPSDFQFAAGVAACGMLLRHSQYAGQANWGLVKELAESGLSFDPHGHRRAFLGLVSQAESLMGQLRPASPPAPDSTVRGKYKSLLRRLSAPEDNDKYGQFNDYGYSDTKTYAGAENLPAGFWVYVSPHWYIWAETTQKAEK